MKLYSAATTAIAASFAFPSVLAKNASVSGNSNDAIIQRLDKRLNKLEGEATVLKSTVNALKSKLNAHNLVPRSSKNVRRRRLVQDDTSMSVPELNEAIFSFTPWTKGNDINAVCYGGIGMTPLVTASATGKGDFGNTVTTVESAFLDFGLVDVDDHENLLVDVMLQTFRIMTLGDDNDDDVNIDSYGEVVANVKLYPNGAGSPIFSVLPGGLIMSYDGTFNSVLQGGDDDSDNDGNGLEFKSVNNGKFFFPNLPKGVYLLQVEFDLTAFVQGFDGGFLTHEASIGEHIIELTRSADEGQCQYESTRRF